MQQVADRAYFHERTEIRSRSAASNPSTCRSSTFLSTFRHIGVRRLSIVFMLTLLPFFATAVHSVCCRKNLFLGIPHNVDEFRYWRVLYSFAERGFDFASTCAPLGREAPIGPLGEHGLSTLFAWAGALPFGIGPHTLFFWNLAVLSFALAVFALLVKPNLFTALWAVLLVLGNGVVLEQWYSHMMELPCLAAVIVYFSFALTWEKTGRRSFLWMALVVCAYASFMRVCYVVLAFPLILRLSFPHGGRCSFWPFLAYFATFVAIRRVGILFMKPSYSFLTDIAGMGLGEKVPILAGNFALNVGRYFSFSYGTHIEIGQRWFQIALFAILLAAALLARRSGKPTAALAYLANALSLATLVAMLMLLYDVDDWRDVRTTMPFAVGQALWFVAKSFSTEGSLSRRSGIALRGALLVAATVGLFVFAPPKLIGNHPADRFEKASFDLSWLADVPDEKTCFCLFEPRMSCAGQIALLQRLPPRVGVRIVYAEQSLAHATPKPDFVLTSHNLDMPEYELWKKPEGFPRLYRKSTPDTTETSKSDKNALGDKE